MLIHFNFLIDIVNKNNIEHINILLTNNKIYKSRNITQLSFIPRKITNN